MPAETPRPGGLAFRALAFLTVLLVCEFVPLSAVFVAHYLHLPRLGTTFVLIFGAALYSRRDEVAGLGLGRSSFGWGWLAAHAAAMVAWVATSATLPATTSDSVRTAVLFATAGPAVAFGVAAFFPWRATARLIWSARNACLLGLAGSIVSWKLGDAVVGSWNAGSGSPLAEFTFQSVRAVLSLCLRGVEVETAIRRIGVPAFHVRIAPECSGLEGLALIGVFAGSWLWFFRGELRFPRALVLLPASLAVMWMANVVRIAALVLIGSAGFPAIAMGGFHSYAGWISFLLVSFAFLAAAQHVPWLLREPAATAQRAAVTAVRNPTAIWLLPLMAVLCATLLSHAVSGGFEWLYGLRFVAAACVLWWFRAEYARFTWRLSWFGPLAGFVVFVLWMAVDSWQGGGSDSTLGTALGALSAPGRISWLVFRVAAAVVTVPLAEELAFRGFAARRFLSEDFEAIDFRRLSALAIGVSSLLFGVMHGGYWIAGTLAGVVYALAARRSGSISDAVAAHATTNALLAAWVLATGAWHLW